MTHAFVQVHHRDRTFCKIALLSLMVRMTYLHISLRMCLEIPLIRIPTLYHQFYCHFHLKVVEDGKETI